MIYLARAPRPLWAPNPFNEKSFLLREDPRNLDKALYNSVLQAAAAGWHSPTAIGSAIGRDYNNLKHPLSVLESTGFLLRAEDVLTRRRPVCFLADPIVRFSQVVIDPHRALLEERDAAGAWAGRVERVIHACARTILRAPGPGLDSEVLRCAVGHPRR